MKTKFTAKEVVETLRNRETEKELLASIHTIATGLEDIGDTPEESYLYKVVYLTNLLAYCLDSTVVMLDEQPKTLN